MTEFVKIVEVGPRDGLQNEKTPLTLADRKNLILDLMQTGLSSIEVGSCVSAKWVPPIGLPSISTRVLLVLWSKISPRRLR